MFVLLFPELGVTKSRSVMSGISKVSDKKATSQELSKKFESHVLEAKKMLSRYRYNKSDASKPSNEDSEKHGYRSSSPAIELFNQGIFSMIIHIDYCFTILNLYSIVVLIFIDFSIILFLGIILVYSLLNYLN